MAPRRSSTAPSIPKPQESASPYTSITTAQRHRPRKPPRLEPPAIYTPSANTHTASRDQAHTNPPILLRPSIRIRIRASTSDRSSRNNSSSSASLSQQRRPDTLHSLCALTEKSATVRVRLAAFSGYGEGNEGA